MWVPCDGELTLPCDAAEPSKALSWLPWDFIESSVIFCTAMETASLVWAAAAELALAISETFIALQVSAWLGRRAPLRWGKTR
jgi:hypothetical protein